MRFSLINPNWTFEGSIYFGCREPHLPLEYGYAAELLQRSGHEVQLIDAQLDALSIPAIRVLLNAFRPDLSVITTAPSYLFWRCPPPELRVPRELAHQIRDVAGILAVVGPHASTTPQATLTKLGADVAVMGECEQVLPLLANDWNTVESISYGSGAKIRHNGRPHASDMGLLPALRWGSEIIERHVHHHHRFDAGFAGPGAEMETSRGCPYHCTFCAKDNFRDSFRRRPLQVVAEELDGLIADGAQYIYFIDEIFLPYRQLLEMIGSRNIKFGVQTRIDLWNESMLDLLGKAGCVSIEAGVESITKTGREQLAKECKLSTDELTERLIHAKRNVAFVQANLLGSPEDDADQVEKWRKNLLAHGVWANKPVPAFPYPGSPDYTSRWGAADELAWERAHDFYLERFCDFSDIQEQRPAPLVQLELTPASPQ